MSPTRRLLAAASLLVLAAAAPAQPKPAAAAKPPDLDRDLFVLYVIEEFYRDTKLDSEFLPPVGSPGFNTFIQARRGLVDNLVRHLRQAPDRVALVGQMSAYRGVLNKFEELNSKAVEVEGKYREPAEKIYLDVDRELKLRRNEDLVFETLPSMVNAYERVRWGYWGYWGDPVFSRRFAAYAHMMRVGYIKTLQSDAKQERMAIELFSKARQKELAYWETNRPKLESDLRQLKASFRDTLSDARKAGAGKLADAANLLAAKRGWKPAEVRIDPDRDATTITPAERPRDPFPIVWRARVLKAPTLDDPDTLDVAHGAARRSVSARLLVPDSKAYDPFRAMACEVGGQVALAAVTAEAGSGGFTTTPRPGRNPAVTSFEAWEQYQNYCGSIKLVDNVRLLHQVVLARAHHGGVSLYKAYNLIDDFLKSPKRISTEDPEVWYDFARVCAMVKDERPKGSLTLSPSQRAILCLRFARMYGFDRVAEAKACADFARLQAAGKEKKEAFDQALNLPPIRAAKVLPKGDLQ